VSFLHGSVPARPSLLLTLTLAASLASAAAQPALQAVPPVSPTTVQLRFDTVLKGLNLPVSLATDGSHDGRLFISELNKIVRVYQAGHHGGQLAFGPDGYLYIGTGGGEEANHWLHEPPFVAQRLDTLQGKVLRIDVDHGTPYAIPPDNPFVEHPGARGEIRALGFRNPWKLAFDPSTGGLFVSDVGNDRWEEIDRVVAGGDDGWPIREGPECQAFSDAAGLVDPRCADLALRTPAAAYGHPPLDPQGGDAAVGGVVYRGKRWPQLDGRYLYGGFENGRIWSLSVDGPARVELLAQIHGQITSFAQTPDGQLYLTTMNGSLVRVSAR